MQVAFLIIITLLGVAYSLWTKQVKVAFGLFVLTLAQVLLIPEIVHGFWDDIFVALSLIFYTVGIIILVSIKKDGKIAEEEPDPAAEKETTDK